MVWNLKLLFCLFSPSHTYLSFRVNSLSPAGIYSPTLPDDFVDKLTSLIPMGRMAAHNEYKGAIVFLCSAASSYMTGANIVIDGGRSIW